MFYEILILEFDGWVVLNFIDEVFMYGGDFSLCYIIDMGYFCIEFLYLFGFEMF